VQCPLFTFRGVTYVCHPTIVAKPCLVSAQSSAMALFACCGQGLVPVLLVGQSGANPGLELSQTRCLSGMQQQGVFPGLSPEKLSFVGRACSQTQCLPLAHCWSHSWTGLCGYLTLSPEQESLWSGTGPCWGCLHTARLVALLWMGSSQGHIGGGRSVEYGGRVHGAIKVHASPL